MVGIAGKEGNSTPEERYATPQPQQNPQNNRTLTKIQQHTQIHIRNTKQHSRHTSKLQNPTSIQHRPRQTRQQRKRRPRQLPPRITRSHHKQHKTQSARTRTQRLLPQKRTHTVITHQRLNNHRHTKSMHIQHIRPRNQTHNIRTKRVLTIRLKNLRPLLQPQHQNNKIPRPQPIKRTILLPITQHRLRRLRNQLINHLTKHHSHSQTKHQQTRTLPKLQHNQRQRQKLLNNVPQQTTQTQTNQHSPHNLQRPHQTHNHHLTPIPKLHLTTLHSTPTTRPPRHLLKRTQKLRNNRRKPHTHHNLPKQPQPHTLHINQNNTLNNINIHRNQQNLQTNQKLHTNIRNLPRNTLNRTPRRRHPKTHRPQSRTPLRNHTILPLRKISTTPSIHRPRKSQKTIIPTTHILQNLNHQKLHQTHKRTNPSEKRTPHTQTTHRKSDKQSDQRTQSRRKMASKLTTASLEALLRRIYTHNLIKLGREGGNTIITSTMNMVVTVTSFFV